MFKVALILIAIIGGIFQGLQASINGRLGKSIGSVEASFISFVIGTIILGLFITVSGKISFSQILSVPKWQFLGGLIGAVYILLVIIIVPKLGVTSAMIAVIIGQIIISSIIDHLGWFGGKQITFGGNRWIGVMLLVASLYFFNKK